MKKWGWHDYYSLGCFILLTGLGIYTFTKDKSKNLEQKTQNDSIKIDSIPQVTNYEYIGPLIPVYKDPISNIYNSEQ